METEGEEGLSSPEAQPQSRKPIGNLPESSELSQSRKELYQDLIVGFP